MSEYLSQADMEEVLDEVKAENTALRAYVGLVVQYMEKGEPWWYDKGLKEQGRALLDSAPGDRKEKADEANA